MENENLEAAAVAAASVEVDHGWRVFRRANYGVGVLVWEELGALVNYKSIPPEYADVGALGGPGEYMLIQRTGQYGDSAYVHLVTLEAVTHYEKVDPGTQDTIVAEDES